MRALIAPRPGPAAIVASLCAAALLVAAPSSAAVSAVAAADTQPPTAPGRPAPVSATSTSITFEVAPATDNVGVVGYLAYRNGTPSGGIPTGAPNVLTVVSLSPNTYYFFTVTAWDQAGNQSQQSQGAWLSTTP
ncbi:fibronectin type III domain-containing protein [Saccharothrix australiensis]|nr:fibronectin type III domain-containing protein [Saccharothrix australiensis]